MRCGVYGRPTRVTEGFVLLLLYIHFFLSLLLFIHLLTLIEACIFGDFPRNIVKLRLLVVFL